MLGFRSDGKLVKPEDPMFSVIPLIMTRRSDAQVFHKITINTDAIDNYIREKRENGLRYTYMDVVIASLVRIFALRPDLNRFIAGGRLYQRKGIFISFAVKKAMSDDAPETTVKIGFTGNETMEEISRKIQDEITFNKQAEGQNDTDLLVKVFQFVPHIALRAFVGFAKWMDRMGVLPKSLIKLSPFHTTAFFSNLGSINLDYIYHHIYDFGTTSVFITLGKRVRIPEAVDGEVAVKKCTNIGVVVDERICDGYYLSKTLKLLDRLFNHPNMLDVPLYESDGMVSEMEENKATI
ncbi:MAG: 2-oxoglutarate dehydrogenase [Bacillota bacterium]|nr:2-oxoglutarate dehydrogenase [Bacillota bacterium]